MHLPSAALQEFLSATVFLGKLERRELMMAAFAHFDSDGSGFITEEEMRQVGRAADRSLRGSRRLRKKLSAWPST